MSRPENLSSGRKGGGGMRAGSSRHRRTVMVYCICYGSNDTKYVLAHRLVEYGNEIEDAHHGDERAVNGSHIYACDTASERVESERGGARGEV